MPLSAGDLLQNRYRIDRPLGQGGMGTVYLAADQNLFDNLCAIKENAFTELLAQEQFKLQARLLSQLSHPNLPRVTDHFIEPDGRQYLVMDYVEGEDLEARRQGIPQPEGQVLAWLRDIFSAVDYLHGKGVVHRDIKPANIRLCPGGKAVLVDLGIAKVLSRQTLTGAHATTSGFAPSPGAARG